MKRFFSVCIMMLAVACAFTSCKDDESGLSGTADGTTSNGGAVVNKGTLKIQNKTEFAARAVVEGLGTYNIPAESYYTIENVAAGSYVITYTQISTYSFAPVITETTVESVDAGYTTSVEFPSCYTALKLVNGSDDPCTFTVSRTGYTAQTYPVSANSYIWLKYINNDGTYQIDSRQTSGYTFYPDTHTWTYTPSCGYYHTFTHTTTFKGTEEPEQTPVEQ